MAKALVLFGVESVFTPEMIETAQRSAVTIVASIQVGEPEWDMRGLDVRSLSGIDPEMLAAAFAIPWVTPGYRQLRMRAARAAGFSDFGTLVDPAAVIASSADIGPGVYANSGVAIGAFAQLGEGVLVNRNASVGHHSMLAPYVSLGPGATVAARCRIGKGVMIGAGAVVAPGVAIGDNSVVAVGAAVARDVPERTMVAGNPARAVRSQIAGYRDLAVE